MISLERSRRVDSFHVDPPVDIHLSTPSDCWLRVSLVVVDWDDFDGLPLPPAVTAFGRQVDANGADGTCYRSGAVLADEMPSEWADAIRLAHG